MAYPYTSEAFGQLKELFPEVKITSPPTPFLKARGKISSTKINSNENISQIKHIIEKKADYVDNTEKSVLQNKVKVSDKLKPEVEITITPMHLFVKLAKDDTEIQFVEIVQVC
jgi:uncharacterized protein (DUF342 family)